MNPLVPDFILQQEAEKRTTGTFVAAGLFVDIPGFTTLTEKLVLHGREGAEILAGTLRFYFDPLVALVHEAGGFITSFAGDAFTAVFPHTLQRHAADAAINVAVGIQQFFAKHPEYKTKYGNFPFSFKIGLSWGEVEWGIVDGASARAFYYFHGPAIDACAKIEHHAQKGDILLDSAFHQNMPKKDVKVVTPGVFKLTSSKRPVLRPFQRVPPTASGARFVAPGILDLPPQGEFRNVASAFLAFDGVANYPELIALLDEHANRYGGTFTGLDFGDKGVNCLVHFGAPIAHENDLERALDFVLALRKSLPRPIRMRAGVTSDVRYTGWNGGTQRHEFACIGRATNLAARLMMKAPWKEVWGDRAVFNNSSAQYQWKAQGEHTFKGFDQPLAVYSLERKKINVQKEFFAKAMIGRDVELKRLQRNVEPIFAGRSAGIVYVEGDPGLGKSFLVETFRRNLENAKQAQPFLWIDAPCDQTLRTSLNPFEYALRTYFRQSAASGKEENHSNFDDALDWLIERLPEAEGALKRELGQAKSFLAALVGIRWQGSQYERSDPKARFASTLAAIAIWIRAESMLQPVILHIEDAHWMDAASIQAVQAIAAACANAPAAIVASCRYRDDGSPFRVPLPPEIPQHNVALGPLPPDKIRELATLLTEGPVSDVLAAILADNAGGNPFFAEQFLAYWQEESTPLTSARADTSVTMPSVFMLPNDVNAILIARLDRLAPPVKRTIQAASVLGREFDIRVLAAMLEDEHELAEQIKVAERQTIWSPMDDIRYQFRNALLRNAAYEMQARARLQELHQKAAAAIERVHNEDLSDYLPELGRHWKRAGVAEKAREYFLAGARDAVDRYAHAEAKRLYRSYLKLISEPTPQSVIVRYELARDVLEIQGQNEEAKQEHIQVIYESQQLGDRATEGLGLLGLGRVHWAMGLIDTARELYEQSIMVSREVGQRWTEGLALGDLAILYKDQGRFEEARALYEYALAVDREVGNRKEEGRVLGNLALLYKNQGMLEKAKLCDEQAQEIQREIFMGT
ncbi:MAG: AAA family ATPase [Polyangiaceae bacterium]|nr:AAA family ATPase [Polyangiaceae bacterium]